MSTKCPYKNEISTYSRLAQRLAGPVLEKPLFSEDTKREARPLMWMTFGQALDACCAPSCASGCPLIRPRWAGDVSSAGRER